MENKNEISFTNMSQSHFSYLRRRAQSKDNFIDTITPYRMRKQFENHEEAKKLPNKELMKMIKEQIKHEAEYKAAQPKYTGISWDQFQKTKLVNKSINNN